MNQETSCGAIIYRPAASQIEYLLIRQTKNHDWTFPKGHQETGENYRQTAIREVKEETNLDIDLVPGFEQTISYSHEPGLVKKVIFFLAQPISDQIQPQAHEIENIAWLPYEKALSQLTYDDVKKLLILVHTFLAKQKPDQI